MLANQTSAMPARARRLLPQRPFVPPQGDGVYKLPRAVQDRLQAALAPCRNRDAAHRLAVFLGRYWTSPKRIVNAFPVDRRALADHEHLDLTESEIRGAIGTLERIGFLTRDLTKGGSRYKATAEGLHRKPILFRFDSEYGVLFAQANRRAEVTRQHRPASVPPASSPMIPVRGQTRPTLPVPGLPAWSAVACSPKNKIPSEGAVIMGEQNLSLAKAIEPDSPLERALRSLRQAIGGGSGPR